MIVDYHMHLRNRPEDEPTGRYAIERLERYVERAIETGVDEIGLSDHLYHFDQSRPLWEIQWMLDRSGDDLDEFVATVEEGKRRGLPVKLAIEADYLPEAEEGLAELLDRYPWDYVLGSVHFVGGIPVDMPPALTHVLPAEDAWRRYFDALQAAASSGLFDVLSHPDLVKIFGIRPAAEVVAELNRTAAQAVAAAGVALEVSSAGLRKPVGELYPDASFLAEAAHRGIPITLASDAHEPDDVGRDLKAVVELARSAGYQTVSVFERRNRRQEPLG